MGMKPSERERDRRPLLPRLLTLDGEVLILQLILS
jgi:hypothetical protein